jgi:hypothetical protein
MCRGQFAQVAVGLLACTQLDVAVRHPADARFDHNVADDGVLNRLLVPSCPEKTGLLATPIPRSSSPSSRTASRM